jgi:hypothetical protein
MITPIERRSSPWVGFSILRWGAVFAGLAVGLATQIVFALIGLAAGLSAVDPQAADPIGAIPAAAGIWTGLSMLIAAFIGGYVASRLSGVSLRNDGALHGVVTWGVTTVAFVYLATSAAGALLGGTVNILAQGLQGAGQVAASGQPEQPNVSGIVEEGQRALNQATERLTENPPGSPETADKAVSTTAAVSWWLVAGMLLSLASAAWGGSRAVRVEHTVGIEDDSQAGQLKRAS